MTGAAGSCSVRSDRGTRGVRRGGQQMTETVVASTAAGRVRGRVREHSMAFRGIPYAAAPVGGLRFQAPVPHPGWSGVRGALENGPTPSLGPTTDTYSIPEPVVAGNEVLNLNVFTPTLDPSARLPVYVWIHGGGFVGGDRKGTRLNSSHVSISYAV